MLIVHLFVCFIHVSFCHFSLGVGGWLRFVIVALPGLFLFSFLNNVMLSIKTSGAFYLFNDFPYRRILTLYVRYLGTLNIANSICNSKMNKKLRQYAQILLFNNNVAA